MHIRSLISSFFPKRWLLAEVGISLAIALAGTLLWFLVQQVDEDLCHVRRDDGGLFPLDQRYEPGYSCDPKLGMTSLMITYYFIFVLPVIMAFGGVLRLGILALRRWVTP